MKYALAQEKKPDEIKQKKQNLFINFNLKERYSGLHYDENEIFNTNYDIFISNKLSEAKKNKIKNLQLKLKVHFLIQMIKK